MNINQTQFLFQITNFAAFSSEKNAHGTVEHLGDVGGGGKHECCVPTSFETMLYSLE